MARILVTGGTGYIGSHTCVALTQAGHAVTILDNFSNSKPQVLERLESLCVQPPLFVQADIRDAARLDEIFKKKEYDAVIHFAGLKAVGESNEQPLSYYDNNVRGTLDLLGAMQRHGPNCLVFSSSATVYGEPQSVPIREDAPTKATNPYGRTKLFIEHILRDLHASQPHWKIACLRYFNPVGAHASGLIGEDPLGVPNNLMPYVAQVATGQRAHLNVWGNDYDTADGTGVRDYIHVSDLGEGHVAALAYLQEHAGMITVNLGTGQGYSVLEMVKAFEQASRQKIPFLIGPRRAGDIATCFADPSLASTLLKWRASRDLTQMCQDAWHWQSCEQKRNMQS